MVEQQNPRLIREVLETGIETIKPVMYQMFEKSNFVDASQLLAAIRIIDDVRRNFRVDYER